MQCHMAEDSFKSASMRVTGAHKIGTSLIMTENHILLMDISKPPKYIHITTENMHRNTKLLRPLSHSEVVQAFCPAISTSYEKQFADFFSYGMLSMCRIT